MDNFEARPGNRMFRIGEKVSYIGSVLVGLSAEAAVLKGPSEECLAGGGLLVAIGVACMLRSNRILPPNGGGESLPMGTLHVLPVRQLVEEKVSSDLKHAA